MAEKSFTSRLVGLREQVNKKEIGAEELIAKHYEIVKQLAEAGREDEAFQLYNSTMQLEASLTNRKTAEVMGETALHLRDTEGGLGGDVDKFVKSMSVFGEKMDDLHSTGNTFARVSEGIGIASTNMLNVSGEMSGAVSKMGQAASTIDGAARIIDNASNRMSR